MTHLAINCSYQMYMVFRSHSHMHVIMMTHCNVLVLSKVASIPWFWWLTWSLWSVLQLGWVAPRLKQYAKDSSESKWVSEDQLQSDLLESSWDLKLETLFSTFHLSIMDPMASSWLYKSASLNKCTWMSYLLGHRKCHFCEVCSLNSSKLYMLQKCTAFAIKWPEISSLYFFATSNHG